MSSLANGFERSGKVKNKILSVSLAMVLALGTGVIGCTTEYVPEYSLTISSTEGGSVTTPGEDTYTYDEGEVVNLVAEPKEGYRFQNWGGDVESIDDVNAASTTIVIDDDYYITANFIKQYELTISSTTGGSVTTPGEATYTYDEGEIINLVVQAEGGYHFVNWTGDLSTIANVNATRTSITMLSDYTITANFIVDLYFQTEASAALHGPATLPPEQRNPCVMLQVMTNMIIGSVCVELPDGGSVLLSTYTDVFTPDVDWTSLFRFATCEPGMPIPGGEYIFTALDVDGEPISGLTNNDIWVGVEPPNPPTNVRAEITEEGILVSWDEVPIILGSFEPAAQPQLGDYRLEIWRTATGEIVYGSWGISASSYLIPQDRASFIEAKDWGLSLSEMEGGTYCLRTRVASMAPAGSLGKSLEYFNTDPGQDIVFMVKDGEITIQ